MAFFCTWAFLGHRVESREAGWTRHQVHSRADAQHWKAGNQPSADTYVWVDSENISDLRVTAMLYEK